MHVRERSAGGVVFRQNGTQFEILLIADRFGRWTLPKGKQEHGESDEQTALREINEETGIKGKIHRSLLTTTYTYTDPQHGTIAKEVHYFLVEATGGNIKPQLTEIERVNWFQPTQAWTLQQQEGYANNTDVLLRAFQELGILIKENGKELFRVQPTQLAGIIDHTLLKPDAIQDEIDRLCKEAVAHRFASVCVNPTWVKRAAKQVEGSSVKVCTVIGFPLGATTTGVKVYEAREAIQNGAAEIDMVLPIGKLKMKDQAGVQQDIEAVVQAAEGRLVKVILETGLLSEEEIQMGCLAAKAAGAHFVKTSTGFSSKGATVEAVRQMREVVGSDMGVKASGGIRDAERAAKMVAAGANRIGASASVAIVTGEEESSTY